MVETRSLTHALERAAYAHDLLPFPTESLLEVVGQAGIFIASHIRFEVGVHDGTAPGYADLPQRIVVAAAGGRDSYDIIVVLQ